VSRLLSYLRTHGSLALIGSAFNAVRWRMRDAALARRLRAPGFQAARSPRLLGLTHIHLGPDFHARDFLWLEAVVHYREHGEEAAYEPALRIGASARLSDNVHIGCLHRVTIGDHLLCGSRVLITDHAHGSYNGAGASDPAIPPAQRPLASTAPVEIGNNVWLGDGVAVLAGAQIGDGCVIGANSVVTGAIPAGTIAVGSPARPVRRWDGVARAWLPLPQG
jgi:acetyltransferase-like isoleucine patch superfamily enzyme